MHEHTLCIWCHVIWKKFKNTWICSSCEYTCNKMPNGLKLGKSGVISSSGAFKAQSVGVVWGHLGTLKKVTPWFERVCEWRALMFDCPDLYPAMSSAKPYIGCKIGLISKAQNRYEGILYTIDRGNSTVVLAKGECFRTMIVSIFKIFLIILWF